MDGFGSLPPITSRLHVDGRGLKFLNQLLSPVGESGGGVGGADEIEFTVALGILQDGESVVKGVVSVCDSIIDAAVDVGLPKEPVDDLIG